MIENLDTGRSGRLLVAMSMRCLGEDIAAVGPFLNAVLVVALGMFPSFPA